MSRHTKEKRRLQQLKKEAALKEEKVVFNVFFLLRTENYETKPNMAKFLKNYIKSITGNPKTKPLFYPIFELQITKFYIKFLDGHEIIFDVQQKELQNRYVLYYEVEDVETTQKELKLLEQFVEKLVAFGFIPAKDKMPDVIVSGQSEELQSHASKDTSLSSQMP